MTRDQMEEGKVPTVSTTASVIAGIQCQEAVKLLHGLDVIDGRGFVFEGMQHSSYVVAYTRKDDCPAHDADEPVVTLDWSVCRTRAGDLLERVRGDLGPEAVVEMGRDLLASLYCAKCGEEEPFCASLGKVTERQGACPKCGEHRAERLSHDRRQRTVFGPHAGRTGRTAMGCARWALRHDAGVLRIRGRPRRDVGTRGRSLPCPINPIAWM